tara:strand:+ start:375 stop:1127 length:753 start_codon:yes stop_codon:yes gene_type:complete
MIHILANIFNKRYILVILKKILKKTEKDTSVKAKKWAQSKVEFTTEEFCQSIDKKLFEEIKDDILKIKKIADSKLSSAKHKLGGGGNYFLLYFLVRKFYPKIVVETGVASGWSSLSILKAFQKNKEGKLYSSDFPYFKIKDSEKLIGILARDEKNFKDWILDIRGDEVALKNFTQSLDDFSVDLFHYDSDKTYSGRSKALEIMKKKFSKKAIIIFDDIQDNLHFCDFVSGKNVKFNVLEFEGKYVGIIGL